MKNVTVYKVRRADGYYAMPHKFSSLRWDKNGRTYIKLHHAKRLFRYALALTVRENWGEIELVEFELKEKQTI